MGRPALEPGRHGVVRYQQRTDGSWTAAARRCDADGITRPVSASASSKSAAHTALQSKLKKKRTQETGVIGPKTTVADLLRYWWDRLDSDLADSTRASYRRAAEIAAPELRTDGDDAAREKHTSPALRGRRPIKAIGNVKIADLTVQRVADLLEAVTSQHGAVRAKIVRVVMKAALGIATRYGAIEHNPVMSAPSVKIKVGDPKALTIEQFRVLRADLLADPLAVAADLPDLVVFLVVTGARTGELLGLRWQDVDLGSTPATVSINGTATHAGGLHRQDRPKTPASVRVLELPPSLTGALLSRQVESDSGSEYVFASSTGTIRSPHNLRRALRSFIERHPEWGWITPKTGRKTCLTWIRDRYGMELASWQAGHADSSVAGRHYVGHRGRGPAVADFFEEVLTGVSEPALSKENVE